MNWYNTGSRWRHIRIECLHTSIMEVYLYNSTVCRLCGEENDNGTLLYTNDDNNQELSEIINTYLPLKVRFSI